MSGLWLSRAVFAAAAVVATACGGIASSPAPSGAPGSTTGAPGSGSQQPAATCPFEALTLLAPTPSASPYDWTIASSLAVDERYVYFTTIALTTTSATSVPGVWRVPKCGGAIESLAPGGRSPRSLRADNQNAYWVDYLDGTVNRVPLEGGPVVRIASDAQTIPQSLVVDDQNVYWTSLAVLGPDKPGLTSVFAQPKAGGPTQTLFTSGTNISDLAVDGKGAAYVSGVGPDDRVSPPSQSLYRLAPGASPAQLAPDVGDCRALVLDESTVYCPSFGATYVVQVGDSWPAVVTSAPPVSAEIAVDHGKFFEATVGSPDPNSFGTLPDAKLLSMHTLGGTATPLAMGLGAPNSIVVDDVNVYFIARQGVLAIKKR